MLGILGGLGGGWRARLRRASFRGVRFYTEEFGGEYGRRWADHEYPGRDTPFAEDLGRRQRVWQFTGYTIGNFYLADRDRIIAACEEAGPGELVHPTLGAVQAVCRTVAFTEERGRGGHCIFQFEFAEAGELQEPAQASDTNLACEFAADDLGAASLDSFAGGFSVAGGGVWVTDNAAGDVANFAGGLDRLRLPAAGYPQGALVGAIGNLDSNASSLVLTPPLLGAAVDDAFGAFTNAGDAGPVVAGMLTMATGWQAGAAPGSGGLPLQLGRQGTAPSVVLLPIPARRARNAAVFERLVRQLALREVGYAVTGMSLDNYEAATALRHKIAAAFGEVENAAADAGDDLVFAALAELLGAITRMIQARAANLNPLVTYRTAATANTLTLAWRLYQNSGRDLELAIRTAARNPAFLPRTGRVLAAGRAATGARR